MLEAIIAVISLIIGMGIGWIIRSKSVSESNPEKVSNLEAELQSTREAEVVSGQHRLQVPQRFKQFQ